MRVLRSVTRPETASWAERRVELVPDGNGEGRDDEDGRDGLDGPPERERPAEGAAQHGGNLGAVRVADA